MAGGGGIRTREALQELTRLANGRTKPLCDPSKIVRRGEITPFNADLWSDYLCLAGQVTRRIHVRGLGPATYSARLPF